MAIIETNLDLQIGERAPDFTLDTPEGETITLDDLRARRTLLIFQRHLG